MDRDRPTGLDGSLDVVVEPLPISAARAFAAAARDRTAGRGPEGDATTGSAAVLRLFRPTAAVAIGRHQALAREARLDHCRAEAIALLRRPTGGGALWLDPHEIAVTLVCAHHALGTDAAARLATAADAVAGALRHFGVATVFRPPNDLEVEGGAKIASLFLDDDGDRALIFATILADFDVRAALTALLVPTEKLTVTGLEHARERVTTLAERLERVPDDAALAAALAGAMAERLGLAPRPAAPLDPDTPLDEAAFHADPAADPWAMPPIRGYETEDRSPRATLRLRLELADAGDTVAAAHFATDAARLPADLPEHFATALAGARLADLPQRADAFVRALDGDLVGIAPRDLVRLAARAMQKHRLARTTGLDGAQTSGLMLAGPGEDAAAALAHATVMLVPYCAKPAWCALRPTPDCIDCGHCEVGDAYRMARDRGLDVTTITNFEHLSETLDAMRARGVTAYVGMCCSDFFLKRHAAFRDAGMDAVLMDVVGATCYELKEEHLAYAGAFRAEATLDLDALEKIVALVPPVATAAVAPESSGDIPPSD